MLRLEHEAVAEYENNPSTPKSGLATNMESQFFEKSVALKDHRPDAALSLSVTLLILSSID